MNGVASYFVKGLIGGVVGLAVGETIIVAHDAIKIRKKIIEDVKKSNPDDKVIVKEAKKSKDIITESIKAAVKVRVEQIKKDPSAELNAMFCTLVFLFGQFLGVVSGFKDGYDAAAEDVDNIFKRIRKHAPDELKKMLDKVIEKDPGEITLSMFKDGPYVLWHTWDPALVAVSEKTI